MPTRNLILGALAVGLLLFGQATARAGSDTRYGPEYQLCNRRSTAGIVECVGRLTKAWDRRLNAAYRKLLDASPESVRRLRAAQRLWIQFRDANCRYYGTGEGTITAIHAAECMRSMTAHRALELEDLLNSG